MNTFEKVKEIISEHSGAEMESIRAESDLQKDLNLDPLSVADLVTKLDDKFKIKMSQENIMKFNTLSDIVDFIEDQSIGG